MVEPKINEILVFLKEELIKNNIPIIFEEIVKDGSKVICAGGFGKVYKTEYKGVVVAVKELILTANENANALKDLSNEINFIQKASHENIVKFHGVNIGSNGTLNLIFDFIEGEDLKHAFSKMDDETKLSCINQLCSILSFLHSKKLIHGDIKPPNIMIEGGNKVKLINFGISKIASKTQSYTESSVQTSAYMFPENFNIDEEMDVENSKLIATSGKTDIWAVGAITSEIFSGGIVPWSNKCKNSFAIEICLVKKKQFPIPREVKNETAIKIIKACTVLDPNDRASADDVIKIIKENGEK